MTRKAKKTDDKNKTLVRRINQLESDFNNKPSETIKFLQEHGVDTESRVIFGEDGLAKRDLERDLFHSFRVAQVHLQRIETALIVMSDAKRAKPIAKLIREYGSFCERVGRCASLANSEAADIYFYNSKGRKTGDTKLKSGTRACRLNAIEKYVLKHELSNRLKANAIVSHKLHGVGLRNSIRSEMREGQPLVVPEQDGLIKDVREVLDRLGR